VHQYAGVAEGEEAVEATEEVFVIGQYLYSRYFMGEKKLTPTTASRISGIHIPDSPEASTIGSHILQNTAENHSRWSVSDQA
jgi:hypothetical protein